LDQVRADKSAEQYVARLHNILTKNKRCLFVLSSGLIGTGPPEIKIGDEIFLLTGVPVAMALRREASNEILRVVGATMAHGLMHAEEFDKNEMSEVGLV
jgi:hypothetical protein